MGTKFFRTHFLFEKSRKKRIFAVGMVNISKNTIERSVANLHALPCCVCNLLIINQLAPPLSGNLISENHKNLFLADEFLFGRLLSCANLFTLKKYLL